MIGAMAALLLGSGGAPAVQMELHGISNVRYDVTYDRTTAARQEIHVEMSFDVDGDGPIRLSLPAWTPGSYELDDFAKNVRAVFATQNGAPIHWDKTDFDTWRVEPAGAGRITLGYDYFADALDVGSAWATSDLAAYNGTNLFMFPEDQDLDFDAEVVIHTEADWGVATGMTAGSATRSYTAGHYDELVDMPTFIGRFDLDSLRIEDKWYRLATYPVGAMAGSDRTTMWDHLQRMMAPMSDVFGDVPWETYTTMIVFQEGSGGGSALEHSNSHYGIYDNLFIGNPVLPSITAHEIFHAWNVKRMRPSDLWPYDYGRAMPTELLWVSEGITDYYADLALVRGGIIPPGLFYQITQGKIDNVAQTAPVALEDASLSTWIQPRDGTATIYYDKGSLAGLMLDVLIRDASDNARSLDDVMKAVYEDAYKQGRGFTEDEWWAEVREAAGGRDFRDFHDAYVDGREPYRWEEILPLAGLRLEVSVDRVPRIGVTTTGSEDGIRVVDVTAGGAAAAAGVRADDVLVRVGGIPVEDNGFGAVFRERFGDQPAGGSYEIIVNRGGQELSLTGVLAFAEVRTSTLAEDPAAGAKAVRIRNGILTGS
jgi:predicted metalloprotease with PDZ domain